MRQLVQPNLSVVGDIGYCLKYADNVAGLSYGEQTAWIAWNNTQFPHHDPIPTDVAVPCWFKYYSEGVNLGHVVWSIPGQGYYSSPYNKPTGHNVLSSIQEVEQKYGVSYVGWSEDISGLKVIEGGDVEPADYRTNSGDVQNYFKNFLGRDADAEAHKAYDDKPHKEVIYAIMDSDEFKNHGDYVPFTFPPLFTKKG